jgi:hypothetical protein
MLLSSESVEQLVAASRTPQHGVGHTRHRESAREAVERAAKELGFSATEPPLPKFSAGEDVVAAACRVLRLTRPDTALEAYRARRNALEQVRLRRGALEERHERALAIERERISKEVKAGRDPGPSAKKARDELAAIQHELDLIPSLEELESVVPFQSDAAIREQEITPAEWPGVVLYQHLVRDSLLVLTEEEKPQSQARMQAELAAASASRYEQTVNARVGLDDAGQAHYVAVRAARLAVEIADLHERLARERRRQERERSIEELAADAQRDRPASV